MKERTEMYRSLSAATVCGANSAPNSNNDCICAPGYDWVNLSDPGNTDCKPGCNGANKMVSPIDKQCHCVNGTKESGFNCVSLRSQFPDCVDFHGNKVPDCLFGYSVSDKTPFFLGGIVLGLVSVLLVSSIAK